MEEHKIDFILNQSHSLIIDPKFPGSEILSRHKINSPKIYSLFFGILNTPNIFDGLFKDEIFFISNSLMILEFIFS